MSLPVAKAFFEWLKAKIDLAEAVQSGTGKRNENSGVEEVPGGRYREE
jgi:hypothetical protein